MIEIDEAIAHAEDVAKEQDKLSKRYDDASGYSRSHNDDIRTSDAKKCERCAAEYRQLAEWLKELKKYKDQDSSTDSSIGSSTDSSTADDCISREDALLCLTGEIKETDTAESEKVKGE